MSCIWNESTGLESSHYTALRDAFAGRSSTSLMNPTNFHFGSLTPFGPQGFFLNVRLQSPILNLSTASKTNLLSIIAPTLGDEVFYAAAPYVVIEVKPGYNLEFSCFTSGYLAAAKAKLTSIASNGNRILTIGFCDGDDGMILTDHEIVTPDEILEFHSNALEVISEFPVANANNIPIDTGIQIEFSEILEANTVTPTTLKIFDRGLNSIAGASAISNNVFTFLPSANLSYNETITIQTTNAILDRFGNAANSASWKFETETMPDTISPEIIARFPEANSNNVLLTTELRIRFNEELNPVTITGANIQLLDSYGNPVGGQFSYAANTVTFQPNAELAFSNQHTIIVTNRVKDLAGNPAKSNTWSFTTEPLPPPMQNFTSIPLSTIELTNTFDQWRVTLNSAIEAVNASIDHFRSLKISTNEVNTNDLNAESVQSTEMYTNQIYSEMILSENGLANNFFISNLNSTDIAANTITVTEMTAATLNAADMTMEQLSANTISSRNIINQDTITTENLIVTGELVANTAEMDDFRAEFDEFRLDTANTFIDLRANTSNSISNLRANTSNSISDLWANTISLENVVQTHIANTSLTDALAAELQALRANTVALESDLSDLSGDVATNAGDTSITDDLQDQIDALKVDDAGKLTKDFKAKDLTVAGDLTVQGSVISTDTETLNVSDNKIVLNHGFSGTTPTLDGIIEVERGDEPNQSFFWNETLDGWQSSTFLIENGIKLEDKYASKLNFENFKANTANTYATKSDLEDLEANTANNASLATKFASKSDFDDLKANTANSITMATFMTREIDGDGNIVWNFS